MSRNLVRLPTLLPRSPARKSIKLTEHTSATGHVDESAGVIRDVRIIGMHSKNGRRYTEACLRGAVKLYEGSPVYMNHSDDRKIEDWVGVLKNCRYVNESVRGDLVLIKSHPMSNAIMESASQHSNKFGLSHSASGSDVRIEEGIEVIESLDHVESVDIVTHPATNNGLFESVGYSESINQPEPEPVFGYLNSLVFREADVMQAGVSAPGGKASKKSSSRQRLDDLEAEWSQPGSRGRYMPDAVLRTISQSMVDDDQRDAGDPDAEYPAEKTYDDHLAALVALRNKYRVSDWNRTADPTAVSEMVKRYK